MFDPDDQLIEQININKNDPIDTQYTLINGIVLTLGAGELLDGDSFTVDVDDSPPASFSPTEPDWIDAMALVTMDGVYDGSNGSGTLTFEVTRGGTHGSNNLEITVYDPSAQEIDQILIGPSDPIDTQYTLVNGLVLSLGEGDIVSGRTFTLDVYDAVGSVVDPDKPLDGTRTDNPNLEYGLSVTPGTFQVNGVTIDVYTGDTASMVLDRITQSAAGVTATFDPSTETVLLTQNTTGQTPTIVLENDTSGFLQAMKLDGAVSTPGVDPDADKLLSEVPAFASIQSGTITVEGVDISIDVATDSLNDVIDRINASGAAATASISSDGQRVIVKSTLSGASLEIDSGSTGFFSALKIPDGSYRPTGGLAGIAASHASQVADAVEVVANAFNAVFDDPRLGSSPTSLMARLRSNVEGAVSEAFNATGSGLRTDFGVGFDFGAFANEAFAFSSSNKRALAATLQAGAGEVYDLFLSQDPSVSGGLIGKLMGVLNDAESDIESQLGFRGLSIDVQA